MRGYSSPCEQKFTVAVITHAPWREQSRLEMRREWYQVLYLSIILKPILCALYPWAILRAVGNGIDALANGRTCQKAHLLVLLSTQMWRNWNISLQEMSMLPWNGSAKTVRQLPPAAEEREVCLLRLKRETGWCQMSHTGPHLCCDSCDGAP